jgi:hypothetical protein
MTAEGKLDGLDPEQCFSVEFSPKPIPFSASHFIVLTEDGGRLLAEGLKTEGNQLHFRSPLLGEISLALSVIRQICRPDFENSRARQRDLAKAVAAEPAQDIAMIEKEANSAVLVGLFKGVKEGRFVFHWQERDREIEPAKLLALALASPTELPKLSRESVAVISSSQERVLGQLLALGEAGIKLRAPILGDLTLDRENVRRVEFAVGRRTHVSDLTPTKIRETAFVGPAFGWQRDASVEGHPLRLTRGGVVEEYAKGLGTHARCELTYALGGKFRTLVSVIGIDAETLQPDSGAAVSDGRAIFSVLADGKEIFRSPEMKGMGEADRIFVNVMGVQSLTLRTDFVAETFGRAAHADWADAQLLD